jgi:hypothetical protein
MPEETQPPKRGPGRPRKVQAAVVAPSVEPVPTELAPPADEWKTSAPTAPAFPPDERIGQTVDNPAWTSISYSVDDRQYRIENGVIVERVR